MIKAVVLDFGYGLFQRRVMKFTRKSLNILESIHTAQQFIRIKQTPHNRVQTTD